MISSISRIRRFAVHRCASNSGENQQLMLDEDGLGHNRTRPAGTGKPGDSRQQMEKQDDQITHGPS